MNNVFYFAAGCANHSFLAFPTWYEYLPTSPTANGLCSPKVTAISDVWLIVAAIIEILLRVAALVAVGFVIYGGVKYITSQGSPDATTQARTAILNAIVGLFIAVSAAAVVQFIAGSIH